MTTARRHHQKLTGMLASRSDIELTELMEAGRPNGVGVGGGSAVLDVEGVSVFAKRIPLTDRELAHRGSTSNLFGLPVFCQYGIGGPSFNAWRELAANIIVTNGVLSGQTRAFPMLYHWRVLPGRSPIAAEHADLDAVVAAYDGCPAVGDRLEALAAASSSLVLFCEHIRDPISNWLRENPIGKAAAVERQLLQIVTFLRDRELLHMDGHFGNMRTNGERIYLSDFGLATSPRFDLSAAERDFAERHTTHDADYAAMRLVNWLVTEVCGITMPTSGGPLARNEYVLRCAAGHIPDSVPPVVAAILTRHAPAAARMNAFYWKLFGGDIHAEYPG
ncbi:serine/threonine protein phosphatase [Nocardia terpenica]|uniref:Serine/threonine protein phosphatase n=1 Tax=Nocardia terpenica TaxID=455432 RepID=A0A164P715_9NOCA|nr:serine/threonine protein phosphatase [Nocardia terpenica]KZM75203.1 serine/threonine protein phosphatase [Nocardia terpenica]NQE93305.1 serine/threonine protein phosphatase [Nocardia terpenica]